MQNPPSTSPMLANATTTPFDATAAKPASPLKSPKQASPVLKKASPALAPAVISAPEDEEKTIFNQAIIDTQPTLPIEPKGSAGILILKLLQHFALIFCLC